MQQILSVNEEFVLEAHKAACSEWKEKIEEKFPALFSVATVIKDSKEYKHFINMSFGEKCLIQEGDYIFLRLPLSNTDWTFAAWDLAKYICKNHNYYPDFHEISYRGEDGRWLKLTKRY